jgi:protein phosphatase
MAREHPNVHVIRRYLGSPVPPEPDFRLILFDGEGAHHADNNQGTQLQPGDILLLCTDGLTDMIWNDEILEVIRTRSGLREASRALVDLANDRGGHDNITVVLIGVPADYKPMSAKKKDDLGWLPWLLGAVVGLFLFVILGSLLTLSLLRRSGTVTATPTVSSTLTALVSETPLPSSSSTPEPTLTAQPTPTQPTATLTPWPTNTPIP